MLSRLFQTKQRLKVITAYKRFFESDDGKLIFRHLVAVSLMYKNNQSTSHAAMSNTEGRKAMILHILSESEVSVEEMEDMLTMSKDHSDYDD